MCGFADYFEKNYVKRKEEWAACHRKESLVNTNRSIRQYCANVHFLLCVWFSHMNIPIFSFPFGRIKGLLGHNMNSLHHYKWLLPKLDLNNSNFRKCLDL